MSPYNKVGNAVIPITGNSSMACRLFGTEVKRFTSEDQFEEMLKEWGFDGYLRNRVVLVGNVRYKPDFQFPSHKIDVEIDEYQHQHVKRIIIKDRQRDAAFQANGWTVLRFTINDIHQNPETCKEVLKAILEGSV